MSGSDPLVSVVIPTYNYARFVSAAVESALAQTYAAREILVIDDGSADNTREVLAPYDGRIRYLYQQNQGLSAARNTGIRAGQGDYIALLDADDLWHPAKLEAQMRYLADHPEVGLLACERVKEVPPSWPAVDLAPALSARSITLEDLVLASRFGPSSVVIARRCFERVGHFDPGLRAVEDREMWLRIASVYPIRKLSLPLWWYRIHPANMSAVAPIMERLESRVLREAFTSNPHLRGRFLLRQKALSRAAFASALRYSQCSQHGKAVARLLESMARWPTQLRGEERSTSWVRWRHLGVVLLRMLRWRASPALPRERRQGSEVERHNGENSRRGLDNEHVWMEQTLRVLCEGEAAAEALAAAEHWGIVYGDMRGNIRDANDCFLRMVGYTQAELRAGELRWDRLTAPESRYLNPQIVAQMRTTGIVRPFAKVYLRKDGSRVSVLAGAVVLGQSGQTIALVLDRSTQPRHDKARPISEGKPSRI
jgi:PAS domain S-box-containing protein